MLQRSINTSINSEDIMKSIIEFLKAIFNNPVIKNDLEEYIVSGNPQSEQDVEKLTREFQQQRQFLARSWND